MGVSERCVRGVHKGERVERGGAQREKREKVSTNCEITTDFFPSNSHLSQIKQSK